MKKYAKNLFLYAIVVLFILLIAMTVNSSMSLTQGETEKYTYDKLVEQLKKDEIAKLDIQRDTDINEAATITVYFKDKTKKNQSVYVPALTFFMQEHVEPARQEFGLTVNPLEPSKTSWIMSMLTFVVVIVISIFLLFFVIQMMQGGGGGGNKVMSFGKTRAKSAPVDEKKKITFENVASYEEEKSELREIVEFLKAPKKFEEIGARIPKGVLLVGPPGTGKTYLARAVAGEAGVPFFSISGSDFVEMFVGVGASRVRDLFDQAKKSAPCIVFIDEIDAVGRRRGAGLGSGHDEREQTLNQLLVEMDGFGVNEGVIILAATNRPDILDPAILRPGRFDRRVVVGRPDVKGREEVLKVHAKGKKIASDVDFKTVAQTTSGFTPADLENLLNESAILAARENKKEVTPEEIRKAFVKIGIGTEKKSKVISAKERKITAYHEAGHAILFELLPDIDPVHIISIIPTGMAGGYTMPLPSEDRGFISKSYMKQQITSFMGGRAAEFLVIGDITTGASSDIEQATLLARNMVTKYGMSDIVGPIQFGGDSDEVFIGRDLAHTRNYGENIASDIDSEVKLLVTNGYNDAIRIIKENNEILHKTAALLMEKEKITGAEFRSLFPEGVLPEKNRTEATATIAPIEIPSIEALSDKHQTLED